MKYDPIPSKVVHLINILYAVHKFYLEHKIGADVKGIFMFINLYRIEPTCRLKVATLRKYISLAIKWKLLTVKKRKLYFIEENAEQLKKWLKTLRRHGIAEQDFNDLQKSYIQELKECKLRIKQTRYLFKQAKEQVMNEIRPYIQYDEETGIATLDVKMILRRLWAMQKSLHLLEDELSRQKTKQAIIKIRHMIRLLISQ